MTIGEIIKDYRDANGISLDEFAKQAGMSKSYVFALEKNEHPKTKEPINPSLGIISRVSIATGLSVGEIYARLGIKELFGQKTTFDLSDLEIRIIDRFRSADELEKQMVLRILKIEEKRVEEKMA